MYQLFSTILGGRLGHVIFYNVSFYLKHPIDIFKIWEGGMSFHGGLIGVIIGSYLFCKKHKIKHDPHIPESDCAATFEVYKNLLSEHGEGFLSQYVVKK